MQRSFGLNIENLLRILPITGRSVYLLHSQECRFPTFEVKSDILLLDGQKWNKVAVTFNCIPLPCFVGGVLNGTLMSESIPALNIPKAALGAMNISSTNVLLKCLHKCHTFLLKVCRIPRIKLHDVKVQWASNDLGQGKIYNELPSCWENF